jgi:hypothetical protein
MTDWGDLKLILIDKLIIDDLWKSNTNPRRIRFSYRRLLSDANFFLKAFGRYDTYSDQFKFHP